MPLPARRAMTAYKIFHRAPFPSETRHVAQKTLELDRTRKADDERKRRELFSVRFGRKRKSYGASLRFEAHIRNQSFSRHSSYDAGVECISDFFVKNFYDMPGAFVAKRKRIINFVCGKETDIHNFKKRRFKSRC